MIAESALLSRIRIGLGLFLFLLIYDGALRKWILPSAEQIIFIAKDVLLLFMLIAVLAHPRERNSLVLPDALRAFLLYVIFVVLEAFNYNLPNFVVGLWGLKSHLLYAALVVLIPSVFKSLDDLFAWMIKIYPWAVVPVCIIAFVQLASPASSFINQQVSGGLDMVSYFGEANIVRVAGTFSYITGMSSFCIVVASVGTALFLGGARSHKFLLGWGFALASLPSTGSRAVVVVSVGSAILMLLVSATAHLISARSALKAIFVATLLGIISLQTQSDFWVALQQRAAAAELSHADNVRAFTAFTNAFSYFDTAGLFGFGSGSTNFGALSLTKGTQPFSWLPVGGNFEEESGRLVLELGIVGWAISLLMRVVFCFWSLNIAMKGRTHTIRVAGIMTLPQMALGIQAGSGIFSPPIGSAFYWFCVAILAMAQYENGRASVHKTRLRLLKEKFVTK